MMTVAVFTFVLLLGNIIREVFALLFNDQASLGLVFTAIGLLLPYVLVFALPMGMLTAMLLVFGRFSADQELTAARAGGISLLALVTPALLLSLAFSLLCATINMDIAPRCRRAYKNLLYDLTNTRPDAVLTEGRFVKDIKNYIIYIGKIRGDYLEDVLITKLDNDGVAESTLRAVHGELVRDPGGTNASLRLFQARAAQWDRGNLQPYIIPGEFLLPLQLPERSVREPKINEMTFLQLREEQRRLEHLLRSTPAVPLADAGTLKLQREELSAPLRDMTSPLKVQMHQQVAFSFACLGFTLVGIPLGIRAHRRETSIGVAIALFLVLVYYSFYILAVTLETRADLAPHLIVWLPNFLFQAVGAVLLWRANKQ